MFFIDYAWCYYAIYGCSNIWLLQECHYKGAEHWKENIVAVITQDRLIDDNLKRQIKNRTLYTRRSFLLSRTFQYISNWSKVFEFLRTLYQLIIYVEVQIGSTVLIYHSWCNSNFESTYKKPSLITLAIFF